MKEYKLHDTVYSFQQMVSNAEADFQGLAPRSLANTMNEKFASLEEKATPISSDLFAIAVFPSEFLRPKFVNKNVGKEAIKRFEQLSSGEREAVITQLSQWFPSFDDSQLFDGFVAGVYLLDLLSYWNRGKPLPIKASRWIKLMEKIEFPLEYELKINLVLFGMVKDIDECEFKDDFPLPVDWRESYLANAPCIPKFQDDWYQFRFNYQPKKGVSWTAISSSLERTNKEERGIDLYER